MLIPPWCMANYINSAYALPVQNTATFNEQPLKKNWCDTLDPLKDYISVTSLYNQIPRCDGVIEILASYNKTFFKSSKQFITEYTITNSLPKPLTTTSETTTTTSSLELTTETSTSSSSTTPPHILIIYSLGAGTIVHINKIGELIELWNWIKKKGVKEHSVIQQILTHIENTKGLSTTKITEDLVVILHWYYKYVVIKKLYTCEIMNVTKFATIIEKDSDEAVKELKETTKCDLIMLPAMTYIRKNTMITLENIDTKLYEIETKISFLTNNKNDAQYNLKQKYMPLYEQHFDKSNKYTT
jgi:hypothetical protein